MVDLVIMRELLEHANLEIFSHNCYCIKLRCNMGWIYETELPEALTWGHFLSRDYKVVTYEECS